MVVMAERLGRSIRNNMKRKQRTVRNRVGEVICCAILMAPIAFGQPMEFSAALKLQKVALDPIAKAVHFDVVNIGSQTITAYGLAYDDEAIPRTTEFFPSAGVDLTSFGIPRQAFWGGIRPGEIMPQNMPDSKNRVPKLAIIGLIFDDRTAIGDEAWIKDTFAKRYAQASEMARWCGLVKSGSIGAMSPSSARSFMETVAQQMRAARVDQKTPYSASAQSARDDLASMLEHAVGGAGIARTEATAVVPFMESRCAAAQQHSKRLGVSVR
jgi:hypothetical protein